MHCAGENLSVQKVLFWNTNPVVVAQVLCLSGMYSEGHVQRWDSPTNGRRQQQEQRRRSIRLPSSTT